MKEETKERLGYSLLFAVYLATLGSVPVLLVRAGSCLGERTRELYLKNSSCQQLFEDYQKNCFKEKSEACSELEAALFPKCKSYEE